VKVAIGKMDVSTGSHSAKRRIQCKGRGKHNQRWNCRCAGGRSDVGLADYVGRFDPVGGDRVRFVTPEYGGFSLDGRGRGRDRYKAVLEPCGLRPAEGKHACR
jgi:hypothetical protein